MFCERFNKYFRVCFLLSKVMFRHKLFFGLRQSWKFDEMFVDKIFNRMLCYLDVNVNETLNIQSIPTGREPLIPLSNYYY
jgi:hypothetical protein